MSNITVTNENKTINVVTEEYNITVQVLATVSTTFISLDDTPASYSGSELQFVRVNAAGTALEFVTSTASVSWGDISGIVTDQTDLVTYVTSLPVSTFTNDAGYLTSIPSTYLESGDNVSELANDAGYLTSYTETDTLQTVTTRGATTTVNITIDGGGLVNSQLNIHGSTHYALIATATDQFKIRDTSNNADRVIVSANSVQLSDYGGGTITGTATKFLAVDVNGNIIEEDAPSGGTWGSITGTITDQSDLTLQNVTTIGNTTTNRIEITKTTSQLLLAYDGTHDAAFTVDASNNITIASQSSGGYFAQGFNQTIASSGNAILLGNQLVANGATNSIVMGISASATAGDSVVQGYLASTQSARTVVIGALSSASGTSAGDSVTIGYNSTTSGRYSVTLGRGVTNSIQNTFQVGFNGNQSFFVNSNSNLMLNSATLPSAGTHYNTTATNTITIHAGTAPSGAVTGAAQIYAESGGTLVIDRLLKRYNGSGTTPTLDAGTLAVFQNNAVTTDNASISIISGDTGDASIFFGISTDENAGEIRYETNANPDRWSLYVEGGTINVRHSNTQHIFYKNGATAVQIYDYFTSTVMSGASGASPWMWFNTSYNITRPQYSSYQDIDTGLAFPSAGIIQLTVGSQEKVKLDNLGRLLVNGSGFTQLYQTQITTSDDAIVDSDTMDVSGTTLLIHRNDNTNNAGCGLGFAAGTANTNIGAMIAFERTNTNSQGRLRFGVKTDTGSGSDLEDNMAINDDGKVHFFDDSIVISTSKTPSSASDTGTQGEIAWDSSYIYVCTATDTWVRAAISTW